MQIRNRKASRRVKLSMDKFVSFSAEGKFSVEINTERLHTVPVDTVSSVCINCFLVHIYLASTSLVPRRSPPLSGEREVHVRAWERVGVRSVSFGDVTKFRAKSISGKGTSGY